MKNKLQPNPTFFEEFELWLQTKERSPNTIEKYLYELKAITGDVVRYFADPTLQNKNLKIGAYRAYLRFLSRKKGLLSKVELLDALDMFQYSTRRGTLHSDKKWAVPMEKWGAYIRKAPNHIAKMGIWLGFHFGLRLSEIVHLRIEDIDFDTKQLLVRERRAIKPQGQEAWGPKYKRERQLPITKDQAKVLKRWITEVRPRDLPSPYVIWMKHGKRKGYRVTIRVFQQWCQKVGLHPHVLRYSFAVSAYYASNNDIKIVSDLLGHANVATTSQYLQLDRKDVIDKARKFFEDIGL